eukprot:58816-Pelagomonas_calceolata.AAC.2
MSDFNFLQCASPRKWLVDPEDLGESLDSGLRFLRRDLSSIAGAACLGLLAVCAFGFVGGLGQSSAWALGGVPYTCVDGIYGPGCSAGAVQVRMGQRTWECGFCLLQCQRVQLGL